MAADTGAVTGLEALARWAHPDRGILGSAVEVQVTEAVRECMAEAGYDPQGAVHLQETFVELSKERREDWLSGLFASHPPSRERVENNRKTAAELPAGGELGRERYQQKIA